MMPTGDAVIATRDPVESGVLILTLNRPKVLNAYDRAMRDGLFEGLTLAADDPTVTVLLLRGAGRAFCSGGDIREFGTAPSPMQAREVRQVRNVWERLSDLRCVSLAGVHGVAAGGGLEMALLCDLLVCATDARLGLTETGLGTIPGVGGTQTLPRAVGEGRAAEMLLTGQWIDGREAARKGLASRAVVPGRLDATCLGWARRLAGLEAVARDALVEALRRGRDLPLPEALSLEKRLARRLPSQGS